MKFKQIFKKAWLPALTVLAISAGAVALNATMRTSEALQLEQIALNETDAPAQIAAMETAVQGDTETTVVTPTPPSTTEPMFKPTGDYSYTLVASEDGSRPGAQDISSFEAGRAAAGVMEAVFGEAFTSGSHDIYVKYQTYNGQFSSTYEIMVGSYSEGDATYIGSVESVSGRVRTVIKWVPDSRRIWDGSDKDADPTILGAAETDAALKAEAIKLITDKFANGRKIEEVIIDGSEWASQDPNVDVFVHYKLRLSTGECYTVIMAYPSRTVSELFIYPLGWDSCLKGYWDEEDSPDYSPADDWDPADGIEPPAVETPRPTAAPMSTQNSAS